MSTDIFCTPEQGRRLKELVPELTSAMVWEFSNWKKSYSKYPLYLEDYVDKIKRTGKYKDIDAIIEHAYRFPYILPALTLQELRDVAKAIPNTFMLDLANRCTYNTAPELAEWVIERLEATV